MQYWFITKVLLNVYSCLICIIILQWETVTFFRGPLQVAIFYLL